MSKSNNETSVADGCHLSTEEQLRRVIEENRSLKSYIDSINNECLELNAALFDEANKMVLTARRNQQIAENRLREKSQENELLRLQMEALRRVIENLPTPILNWHSPSHNDEMYTKKKLVKNGGKAKSLTRAASKLHSGRSFSTLYQMSSGNLNLLSDERPVPTLSTISRSALLDALLSDTLDADEKDQAVFHEFEDWVIAGCPLNTSNLVRFDKDDAASLHEHSKTKVIIVRKTSESKEPEEVHNSSVICNSTNLTRSPSSPQGGSLVRPDSSVRDESAFLHRLYRDDIHPCLDFNGSHLQESILSALPKLSLEMVPISRRDRNLLTSDPNHLVQYCPLLPPLEPSYRLTLNVSVDTEHPQPQHIIAEISAVARHRIAAVVSLFQHLSLIRRGVISLGPQRGPSTMRAADRVDSDAREFERSKYDYVTLSKEFARVQRLRLAIAFARLGFGLPDCD